jgi:NADH-quinone oxidoreductase subunit M
MVFALSNVGMPGTSGFVGEFMIILSTFKASFWVTFFASSTLVIGAAYTLWMYRRVFYGEVANVGVAFLKDVQGSDLLIFVLLIFTVIFFGVFPNSLLNIFHSSVNNLLQLSLRSKIPIF